MFIRSIPEDDEISLSKYGCRGKDEWGDICEKPHVPPTGFLRALSSHERRWCVLEALLQIVLTAISAVITVHRLSMIPY